MRSKPHIQIFNKIVFHFINPYFFIMFFNKFEYCNCSFSKFLDTYLQLFLNRPLEKNGSLLLPYIRALIIALNEIMDGKWFFHSEVEIKLLTFFS